MSIEALFQCSRFFYHLTPFDLSQLPKTSKVIDKFVKEEAESEAPSLRKLRKSCIMTMVPRSPNRKKTCERIGAALDNHFSNDILKILIEKKIFSLEPTNLKKIQDFFLTDLGEQLYHPVQEFGKELIEIAFSENKKQIPEKLLEETLTCLGKSPERISAKLKENVFFEGFKEMLDTLSTTLYSELKVTLKQWFTAEEMLSIKCFFTSHVSLESGLATRLKYFEEACSRSIDKAIDEISLQQALAMSMDEGTQNSKRRTQN